MPTAQLAPAYKLPTGMPVLLMLCPSNDVTSSIVYERLRSEFAKRIRFVKLDSGSNAGKDAAKAFSVENPPAWVLADSKGCPVEKVEGPFTSVEMRAKLNALAKGT